MLKDILKILEEELSLELNDVTEKSTLFSQGIDSITFMTLVIYIEEKYGIEFTFDGIFMQKYSEVTFGNLIEEIQNLIDGKIN